MQIAVYVALSPRQDVEELEPVESTWYALFGSNFVIVCNVTIMVTMDSPLVKLCVRRCLILTSGCFFLKLFKVNNLLSKR